MSRLFSDELIAKAMASPEWFSHLLKFQLKSSWWSYSISDKHVFSDLHGENPGPCQESVILAWHLFLRLSPCQRQSRVWETLTRDDQRWPGLTPHCADLRWSFLPQGQEALGVADLRARTCCWFQRVLTSPKPQDGLCPSCSCCSHLLSGRRPLAPPLFQCSEASLLVNILRVSDSPPWSGTAEGTAQTNVLGLPDTGSLRTGDLLPSPSEPSQPWLPWASGAPADLTSQPRGWGRLLFFLFENLIPAKWGEDSRLLLSSPITWQRLCEERVKIADMHWCCQVSRVILQALASEAWDSQCPLLEGPSSQSCWTPSPRFFSPLLVLILLPNLWMLGFPRAWAYDLFPSVTLSSPIVLNPFHRLTSLEFMSPAQLLSQNHMAIWTYKLWV